MTAYRYDYEVITQWIEPGEKVLDLGCGDGDLLRHLIQVRQVQGHAMAYVPFEIEPVAALHPVLPLAEQQRVQLAGMQVRQRIAPGVEGIRLH